MNKNLKTIEQKFLNLSPFSSKIKPIRPQQHQQHFPEINLSQAKTSDLKKKPSQSESPVKLPKIRTSLHSVRAENATMKRSNFRKLARETPLSSIDEHDSSIKISHSNSVDSFKANHEFSYLDTAKTLEYIKNYDTIERFDASKCAFEEVKLTSSKITDRLDESDVENMKSLPSHNIPYKSTKIVEDDPFCNLCQDCKIDEIAYPCRICTKVFHLTCLEKNDLIQNEYERELIVQEAFSNIGWSCFECANLSRLIPETEIREIIDAFEFSDVDQDFSISKEEFLRMRMDEFYNRLGVEMCDEDIEVTKLRFDLTDTDRSGHIDWDEYLNFECIRRLHRIPSTELVLKLTEKEIARARETFRCFDKDMSGTISMDEASRAHRNWFSKLYQNKYMNPGKDVIDFHVDVHNKILMEAALNGKSEINWDEYLQHEAVNILSNRPNYYSLGKTKSKT